jgi:hypothetical protein
MLPSRPDDASVLHHLGDPRSGRGRRACVRFRVVEAVTGVGRGIWRDARKYALLYNSLGLGFRLAMPSQNSGVDLGIKMRSGRQTCVAGETSVMMHGVDVSRHFPQRCDQKQARESGLEDYTSVSYIGTQSRRNENCN